MSDKTEIAMGLWVEMVEHPQVSVVLTDGVFMIWVPAVVVYLVIGALLAVFYIGVWLDEGDDVVLFTFIAWPLLSLRFLLWLKDKLRGRLSRKR
jgi:hypothetical protein